VREVSDRSGGERLNQRRGKGGGKNAPTSPLKKPRKKAGETSPTTTATGGAAQRSLDPGPPLSEEICLEEKSLLRGPTRPSTTSFGKRGPEERNLSPEVCNGEEKKVLLPSSTFSELAKVQRGRKREELSEEKITFSPERGASIGKAMLPNYSSVGKKEEEFKGSFLKGKEEYLSSIKNGNLRRRESTCISISMRGILSREKSRISLLFQRPNSEGGEDSQRRKGDSSILGGEAGGKSSPSTSLRKNPGGKGGGGVRKKYPAKEIHFYLHLTREEERKPYH